jgi:CHAT domain-containing protein
LHGNSSTTDNSEQRATLGVVPLADSPTPLSNRTATGFSHPYYWAPFILIGNSL